MAKWKCIMDTNKKEDGVYAEVGPFTLAVEPDSDFNEGWGWKIFAGDYGTDLLKSGGATGLNEGKAKVVEHFTKKLSDMLGETAKLLPKEKS